MHTENSCPERIVLFVLSVDPSQIRVYIIGDPVEPKIVWKKLADQFQKTWANKLTLRKILFSLMLREGNF